MIDRSWGVEAFVYNLPRDCAWLFHYFPNLEYTHITLLIEHVLTVTPTRSPHLRPPRRRRLGSQKGFSLHLLRGSHKRNCIFNLYTISFQHSTTHATRLDIRTCRNSFYGHHFFVLNLLYNIIGKDLRWAEHHATGFLAFFPAGGRMFRRVS